ncbi:MAG: anti-sigma factor [Dehalococcoidia bacterium]|nr:anti-sigma factor [Dehalococcoidia bacterium]
MINPRDHEIISPDLAGYALDALEDDVCRRVEAHLAECENCTSELEELMEGATGLAFAVPTVMPRPRLQERIGAAIDADAALSTGEQSTRSGRPATVLMSPVGVAWYARPQITWIVTSGIAAAFIGLLAVAVVAGVRLNDRIDDLSAQIAFQDGSINAVTASLSTMERDAERALSEVQVVSNLQESTDTLEQQVNDLRWLQYVTSVGSWSTPSFFSGGLQPQAPQGMLVTHSSGDQALLMVNGLAPAPTGSVYQVWLTYEGHVVPGDTFTVDQDGYAVVNLELSGDATEYIGASVTMEPSGGSVTPSDFVVLIGSDQ